MKQLMTNTSVNKRFNARRTGLRFALMLLVVLLGSSVSSLFAQAWVGKHNLSSSAYQSEYTKLKKKGYRLTSVTGYTISGKVRFAAVWVKKSGPSLAARHNLTSSAYQSEYTNMSKKGYKIVYVSGYSVKGSPRFAAIWHKKADRHR